MMFAPFMTKLIAPLSTRIVGIMFGSTTKMRERADGRVAAGGRRWKGLLGRPPPRNQTEIASALFRLLHSTCEPSGPPAPPRRKMLPLCSEVTIPTTWRRQQQNEGNALGQSKLPLSTTAVRSTCPRILL